MRRRYWLVGIGPQELADDVPADDVRLSLAEVKPEQAREIRAGDGVILFQSSRRRFILSGQALTDAADDGIGCHVALRVDARLDDRDALDPVPILPYLRLTHHYDPENWAQAFQKPLQRLAVGDYEFIRLKLRQAEETARGNAP